MTAALRDGGQDPQRQRKEDPTANDRKRAERQSRKEAGEVLVSAWIGRGLLTKLDAHRSLHGLTRGDVARLALMRMLK